MNILTFNRLTLKLVLCLFFSLFLLASVSAVSCGVLNDETPVSAGLTFGGIGQASGGGNYGGDAWEVKDTKGSQGAPVLDTYWKSKVTRMFSSNSYNKEIYLDLGELKCVRGLTMYYADSWDSKFQASYSSDGSSWQVIQSFELSRTVNPTSASLKFDSKVVVARYIKLELLSNPDNLVKIAHIKTLSGVAVPDSGSSGGAGSGVGGTADTGGSGGDGANGGIDGSGDIPLPSDPFADNRDKTNNPLGDLGKAGSVLPSKSIPSILTSLLFGVLMDDGSILFVKLLLMILVFAIVYAVLSSADFGIFAGKPWLVWIVGIIVSILSIRFLTPEFINLIMIPNSTLGVVLSAGITFVVFAYVVFSFKSTTLQRIAWIFFAVVFVGLWWYRRADLGGLGGFVAWIYPAVAFFSLVMAFFDGTIMRYWSQIKGEKKLATVKSDQVINLERKIAHEAKVYAKSAGTPADKQTYEDRVKRYKEIIADLSQ